MQYSYYKFFKEAISKNYESTADVVDSLLQFEKLVNYRFKVTKGNDNYWFISNLLDLILRDMNFYKMVVTQRKKVSKVYLLDILNQFKDSILSEYTTQAEKMSARIVCDTLKFLNKLISALNELV